MEAGARVEVAPYKKGPMDFVLWKPSKPGEPAWPSPCGIATPGRPGWHIECSAMAGALLGSEFDVHGGGIDLTFPHHENEIAQSRCAHGTAAMANVWMHNGFLQVEGEKMSKSLGNFVTINELLHTDKFGGRKWSGEVLRLAMLMTHYRQPIDWTVKRLEEADLHLSKWARLLGLMSDDGSGFGDPRSSPSGDGYGGGDASIDAIAEALNDDLATPFALTIAHAIDDPVELSSALTFLGINLHSYVRYKGNERAAKSQSVDIGGLITARLDARKRKDFAESDRIRDELAKMGIALKDTKNKETGEIETTWEVAR
jgi:cysteinyl-tRNA synthetase